MDLCVGCREIPFRHYLTAQRSQKHALEEKISGYYLVIVARWDNAKGHGTATKGVNYWEGMRDEIWWLER